MDFARLTVRPISLVDDHPTLVEWWNFWKFPPMPKEALPMGLMVEIDLEVPVCAGFLYLTGTSLAWVEWIVASPTVSKADRNEGLDKLVNSLEWHALANGAKLVFTSCKHDNLCKRFREHEWIETDKNMSNFIKNVSL